MRSAGLSRGDFTRPVGRKIITGVIARSACAAVVVVALGASGSFAGEISAQPNEPALTSPPRDTPAMQSSEAVPAPLEIPATANSIPPAPAMVEAPPPGPDITVVLPPAAAPEAPKPAAEIKPPPPPPPTPAEILGLAGKERAKHEKCLANAVYFESRGELLRGQVAVAQVVMNRVFSPYYPKDVCSVVYQNAHQHLACQFTFACDGKSKAITERGAWARAQRIARQTLDGKVWVAAVAKSTHYHAYWVNPSWVAEMKKMFRYGVHTFYRPHRWGDGSQEAGWVHPPAPSISQSEIKPQPTGAQVKPVTSNETNPSPVNAPPKTSTADNKTNLLPATAQAKASATDKNAKPQAAASARPNVPATDSKVKTPVTDSKAKIVPANAKSKGSTTDNKTKPVPANAQAKASAADSKGKLPPASAQAKSSQKVSAQ